MQRPHISRIHLPPLEKSVDVDTASSAEGDEVEVQPKKPASHGKGRRVRMVPTLDPSQSPFSGSHDKHVPRRARRTRTCPAQAFVDSSEEKREAHKSLTKGSKSCRHRQDIQVSPHQSPQLSFVESVQTQSCKTSPVHQIYPPTLPSSSTALHRHGNSHGILAGKHSHSRNHMCFREPSQLLHGMRFETWTETPSTTSSSPALQVMHLCHTGDSDFTPTKIVKWRCGSKIGQGSYGSVFKALELTTGTIFAVKKAVVNCVDQDDRRFLEKLQDELAILQDLRHPNIVSYLGHEVVNSELCIFMEYVPGGSIASMLREFGALNGDLLRSTTVGSLRGLNYLHTRNPPVCHRDIKGANVLVDLHLCIKLADFGCSKRSDLTTSFTTIGSIPWMAPEVIQQQDGHGRKADIWSLGCTVIEMATAEIPWGKGAFDNVINALQRIGLSDETPPIPDSMPPDLRTLVHACLSRKVDDRPWASDLLENSSLLMGKSSIEDW